jgi:hypothetical protein
MRLSECKRSKTDTRRGARPCAPRTPRRRHVLLTLVMTGLAVGTGGCVHRQTTRLVETRPDGVGFTYELESVTPAFGRADAYDGTLRVMVRESGEWEVATGQAAQGLDSAEQVAGLEAGIEAVVIPLSAAPGR